MSDPCPSQDALVRFWQGEADEATLEHISNCNICTQRVDEIRNDWGKQKQADMQAMPFPAPINPATAQPTIEASIDKLGNALESAFDCQEVQFIGKGGQCLVFEVTRNTNEGECRLLAKVVDLEYVTRHLPKVDPHRLRSRLKREYSIANGLNHENIYRVVHFRDIKRTSVLWMERVRGLSLQDLGKQRSFTVADACNLLKQMAQALDYNIKHNIVHRDLSPANIMYDEQSKRYVLIDYGLSKQLLSAEAETVSYTDLVTVEHSRLGTPGFVSDEQWNDAGAATYPTDIYALARVTLWLLSAGEERTQIERRDKNYRMPTTIPLALRNLLNDMLSPSQNLRPDPVSLLERVEQVERQPQGELVRRPGAKKGVLMVAVCAMFGLLYGMWPSREVREPTPTVRVCSSKNWAIEDDELFFSDQNTTLQPEGIEFGEFQDVEIEFSINCDSHTSLIVFGPTTESQLVALVLDREIPPINRLWAANREHEAPGTSWQPGAWRQIRLRAAGDVVSSWCAAGIDRTALDNANAQRISGLSLTKGTIGLRIESKFARIRDLKITDLQTKRVFKGPPKDLVATNSIFLKRRP